MRRELAARPAVVYTTLYKYGQLLYGFGHICDLPIGYRKIKLSNTQNSWLIKTLCNNFFFFLKFFESLINWKETDPVILK